jgi:CBS domain containing-hemolysin-like protein
LKSAPKIIKIHFTVEASETEDEIDIQALGDGTWRMLGSVTLDELEKELGIDIPHEDCDTIGGLALAKLGSIPAEGTAFRVETEALSIQVESVLERQVKSAIISKIVQTDDQEVEIEDE